MLEWTQLPRTELCSAHPLALDSRKPEIWVNDTGLATQIVMDTTLLALCHKVASQTAYSPATLRDMKNVSVNQSMASVRLRLALRSSAAFRLIVFEFYMFSRAEFFFDLLQGRRVDRDAANMLGASFGF
jgi:hypothetical protein